MTHRVATETTVIADVVKLDNSMKPDPPFAYMVLFWAPAHKQSHKLSIATSVQSEQQLELLCRHFGHRCDVIGTQMVNALAVAQLVVFCTPAHYFPNSGHSVCCHDLSFLSSAHSLGDCIARHHYDSTLHINSNRAAARRLRITMAHISRPA